MRITCHHYKSTNGVPVILDDNGEVMEYSAGLSATLKKIGWSRADFAKRLGYKSKRSVEKFWQGTTPPAHVLNILSVELRSPPKPRRGSPEDMQLSAISWAHTEATRAAMDARAMIEDAVDAGLLCGELLSSVKETHKGNLNGYLAGVITGEKVKDYFSFLDANRKRNALMDKGQLHLLGVLHKQTVNS